MKFELTVEESTATGITTAKTVSMADGIVYDLTGRRVLAPKSGRLYILNGKKVVF